MCSMLSIAWHSIPAAQSGSLEGNGSSQNGDAPPQTSALLYGDLIKHTTEERYG